MNLRPALALAALLCLACGCSPVPLAAPSGPPLSMRARIVWVGERPPAPRRARLLEHLDRAELAYRAAFGCGPLAVAEVELWDSDRLPAGLAGPQLRSGEILGGASWPLQGRISLPWRGRYPLGAAVHELHHVRQLGRDPGHRGRSWRRVAALDRRLAWESWGLGW